MKSDILKIKLAIVDDHPLVIEGLKSLVKSYEYIRVVGSFASGQGILDFLEHSKVDIVLLDINLPDMNGIEVCEAIRKGYQSVDVIGLSTYGERSIVNQMIAKGAKGYLLKNVTESELIQAIKKVYRGSHYYGNEVQQAMADTIFHTLGEIPRLTKREKQVLKLIVSGKTSSEIAQDLYISQLTVETHRRNLMKKMNATNTASLVRIAIEKVLV